MQAILLLVAAAVLSTTLAGCASKPKEEEKPPPKMSYVPEEERREPARATIRRLVAPNGKLAGRTIRVAETADLVLKDGEVILTFDDGPLPRKTPAVLDTLDEYGVKATFLMTGQMAERHPHVARLVAARGHTIGNHSYSHSNLARLSFDDAVRDIGRGRQSISAALAPSGGKVSPFFRFPYLADTLALRRHLAAQGVVVIDPTIDSKDYLVLTSDQVRRRTLALLERSRSGIILFHDLHARTVAMLPAFLSDLQKRGFKVVHIVPSSREAEKMLIAALAPPRS